MSFRSIHHVKAAREIEATGSLVELAKLEADELEGGSGHRQSLVDEFTSQAKAMVAAGITEETQLEVMEILEGVEGSIVLAALEGDSQDDDDTGPGESREGGGSPSAVGSQAELQVSKPDPKPQHRAVTQGRRIVGRIVRVRQPDGTVKITGMGQLRRRGR